ncbi:MAG: MAPEG family protein [Phormidium sp. BM_Day4_Bin.17]|nr:MAPEG family protein [Phormidium sp. BM_Day4_Bin.17]UCJ11221.1 MAG: MAPEG family protein [Phormidium sp. PBR-2020]
MISYPWTALVTVAALILYFVVTLNVGRARFKYQVSPPATSGNPDFERVFRVQQNTVEQIVLFIPALWVFSLFVSQVWGAALGTVWVIGRILFAWGYYQAPEKRAAGFGISSLVTIALLLGSLIGVGLTLYQTL